MDYRIIKEENIKKNEKYIDMFVELLKEEGKSDSRIHQYLRSLKIFLNDYLSSQYVVEHLRNNELAEMKDGMALIERFFAYWFHFNCMWSIADNVRFTADVLIKFYKLMCDSGYADKKQYDQMCTVIEENMDEWLWIAE